VTDPSLSYVFTTAAVAIVGVVFVIRRTSVLRSTYALCEALALFGMILRFMGFSFERSLPFYVGGFVLIFFFGPRAPPSA
jgi:hypothetical protein